MEKLLKDLITTLSAKQLQGLLKVKEALGSLEERKGALQKELDQIKTKLSDTLETISGLVSTDVTPEPKKAAPKKKVETTVKKKEPAKKKPGGKKKGQPSLAVVVAEVMREKGAPMSPKELGRVILEEKRYKTQSKDFNGAIRILLSKDKGKTFKKVGKALYTLAD